MSTERGSLRLKASGRRFKAAAILLGDAAEDLLAHKHFSGEHRTRLHPTNPLVGVFQNVLALL